jgi:hypothetical protein
MADYGKSSPFRITRTVAAGPRAGRDIYPVRNVWDVLKGRLVSDLEQFKPAAPLR